MTNKSRDLKFSNALKKNLTKRKNLQKKNKKKNK